MTLIASKIDEIPAMWREKIAPPMKFLIKRRVIRGYVISGVPSISGTKKFPNPPIMNGFTVKKIITNA